jgi:enolase-phosphatase E1
MAGTARRNVRRSPRAILTDIEGTTSSIGFVHEVLFPYAKAALPAFVQAHCRDPAVAALLDQVRTAIGEPDASTERVIDVLLGWIDGDRKATPLKALQGLVWQRGYEAGDFTGHIYADAARNLRRWHDAGLPIYVYSSGSAQSQELLFRHSDAGDLTPLFAGHFDTRIGPKREPSSYAAIAEAIGAPPGDILFLSDVVAELDAAAAAGMQTILLVRDAAVEVGRHRAVTGFDEIVV